MGLKGREESTFGEPLSSGVYVVKFSNFFPSTPQGVPTLTKVSWQNGSVIRCHLPVAEGAEEGGTVPASINWELDAVNDFLGHFGVAPFSKLPSGNQLLDLEEALEKGGKEVCVVTNKSGWFVAFTVPDGSYHFKLSNFSPRVDGKPIWYEREQSWQNRRWMSKEFKAHLRVVEGTWAGHTAPLTLQYAIQEESGELWYNIKTKGGRILGNFFTLFGGDPEEDFEYEDPNNILPELEQYLILKDRTALGTTERGFIKGDKLIPPVSGTVAEAPVAIEPPKEESVPETDAVPETPKTKAPDLSDGAPFLVFLTNVIEKETQSIKGGPAFKDDGQFTEDGAAFCREQLGPICGELGYERNIYKLTDEQIVEVIDRLEHKQVASLLRKRLSTTHR